MPLAANDPALAEELREPPTQRLMRGLVGEAQQDSGPDTLSDVSCESGVQLRAPGERHAAFEPAPRASDSGAEPGEITLVSIYDDTGLQHPEAEPMVEVLSEGGAALSVSPASPFVAPDLDAALSHAVGGTIR